VKAGANPDAGFEAVMAKLGDIDARLDDQLDAMRNARGSMVTSNEVWGWMFVLPACAILAFALVEFLAPWP
jgi:hypothetical protein